MRSLKTAKKIYNVLEKNVVQRLRSRVRMSRIFHCCGKIFSKNKNISQEVLEENNAKDSRFLVRRFLQKVFKRTTRFLIHDVLLKLIKKSMNEFLAIIWKSLATQITIFVQEFLENMYKTYTYIFLKILPQKIHFSRSGGP